MRHFLSKYLTGLFTSESFWGGNQRGCEEEKTRQKGNEGWSVDADKFEVWFWTESEDLVDDEAGQGLPALENRGIFEAQDTEDVLVDVEARAHQGGKQKSSNWIHPVKKLFSSGIIFKYFKNVNLII